MPHIEPPFLAIATLSLIETDLSKTGHRAAPEFSAALHQVLAFYEPLAQLGQAVLDEHRAALAHERNVTDPALKRAAYDAQQRAYKLREALL